MCPQQLVLLTAWSCVHVCVCMRACVRACVRACACVCHHHCLYDVLVIYWERWESERVTLARLRLMWGDTVSMSDRVCHRQLEWLGHVARMENVPPPMRLLILSLPFPRPACGPRLWWKDIVSRHLPDCGCRGWFGLSRDRNRWRREVVSCVLDAEPRIERVTCPVFHQSFR